MNIFEQKKIELEQDASIPKTVLDNTDLAVIISKMVTDKNKRSKPTDKIGFEELNLALLKRISNNTGKSMDDTESIMQLLPDIKRAAHILISNIISPKDMMNTEIIHNPPNYIFPSNITSSLTQVIKTYLSDVCSLEDEIHKILEDVLFNTGSYAVCILPENTVDDLINGPSYVTTESLNTLSLNEDKTFKNIGILGPAVSEHVHKGGVAIESLRLNYRDLSKSKNEIELDVGGTRYLTNIFVTDNIDTLKIPLLNAKITSQAVNNLVKNRDKVSFENFSTMSNDNIISMTYRNRINEYVPIKKVRNPAFLKRTAVGHPLVMHLPSDSVIPVHSPSSVEKLIGIWVLLDEEGNPISRTTDIDQFKDTQSYNSNPLYRALNSRTNRQTNQSEPNDSKYSNYLFNESEKIYAKLVEADILARLKNGVYGNGVALAEKEELFKIMFARTMSNQRTQILFIPIEMFTYFAFKYNRAGVGVSLIDGMRVLLSLRCILSFVNVVAGVKNSISHKTVGIKLDEQDPDPFGTIEDMLTLYANTQSSVLPVGALNSVDIVDWLKLAGVNYTFTGHPSVPDMELNFEEKNTNYAKPDTDLDKDLYDKSMLGIGIPPEMVDNSRSPEFAASVTQSNVLLAKYVLQLQEKFSISFSDYAQKRILHSGSIMEELTNILKNNIDDIEFDAIDDKIVISKYNKEKLDDNAIRMLVEEFVLNYYIGLPKPNHSLLENHKIALQTYIEYIDLALDAFITDKSLVESIAGPIAEQNWETIRNAIKGYFVRDFITKNGLSPELGELTAMDDDGDPLLNIAEIHSSHVTGIIKTIGDLIVKLKPIKDSVEKVVEVLNEDESDSSSVGDYDNDNLSNDDTSDLLGDDTLNFDDEMADLDNEGSTNEDETETNSNEDESSETNPDNTDTPVEETKKEDEDDGEVI